MRVFGRIAGESLRSVLPVFLGLALAIAGLIYWLSQKESRWGLMEETSAYAVTIAEFVDREGFAAMSRGELVGVDRERFLAPLVKVMTTKRIGRLWGCRPGESRPLFVLGREAPAGDVGVPAFAPGQTVVTRLRGTASDDLDMEAFAQVQDIQGASLGTIGVAIDTGSLIAQGRADRRRGGWGLGVALLVGAACAGGITLFLNRRLVLLTAMARMAGDGQYGREPEVNFGRIQEIRSLGSTFNTVMGILQGHLSKVQRQILTIELAPDDNETARVLQQTTAGPSRLQHGETLLMVQSQGLSRHNLVTDLFVDEGRTFALLARLATQSRGLEAALETSALRRLLAQAVPARGLAAGLALARQLFPLDDCFLACLEGGGEELAVLSYHKGEDPGSPKNIPVPPGRPQLFHNLGPEFDGQCAMLQEAFPDAAPEALMTGALGRAASLAGGPAGSILLVMRRLPAAAADGQVEPIPQAGQHKDEV